MDSALRVSPYGDPTAFPTPLFWLHSCECSETGLDEAGSKQQIRSGDLVCVGLAERLFPIMHGVRVYALEAGIHETNTFERIERLRELGRFEPAFARDLAGAYDFMLSLRLSAMLENVSAGLPATDSHIAPDRLDHFERDLLRDALRTVERFKRLVHHHFKLHLLS